MRRTSGRETLSTVRALFLTLTTIAGLVLCLTVMHGPPAEQGESSVPVATITTIGDSHAPVTHVNGAPNSATACDAPCGSGHVMTASHCAVALVTPLLLIGATRSSATWGPFHRGTQCLAQRVGAMSSPKPPSLHFLSISRT